MDKLSFKVHRTMHNMSQKDVAEKVGVDRNTYASWEKYKTYPDAMQLLALSKIFECSLDTFYFPEKAS